MGNQIEIELCGPAFIQSAIEISHTISVKSIAKLLIYNVTADSIKALEGALHKLSGYFVQEAIVIITTSQNLPANTKAVLTAAGGNRVSIEITQPTISVPFSMFNQGILFGASPSDQSIFTQMNADLQKQQAERWKILQDTQTKIFEITQDVTVNKAKTADRAFQRMDEYIRN